jgi:hypothetical protein
MAQFPVARASCPCCIWTRNLWDYEISLDKTFTEKLRLQPTSITVRKAPGDTSRAGKFYSAKDEDG